jgi:hypothetical protein
MAKPKPKPKPKGFYWSLGPGGIMSCGAGGTSQTVSSKLWEAEAATEAHDELLMETTIAINEILHDVAKKCPDPAAELAIISFRSKYMLAWARPIRGLSSDDDPLEVAKALRLRRDDPDYPEE